MTDTFFGHVIDGEEVPSVDGATFDVWNPWTQEVFAQAAEGGSEDAARAVASSRQAFDEGPWPRLGRVERAAAIHRLADVIEAHADELATLDTTNMGKPLAQARHDVGRSVANFRFFADHQRDHTGETYPMDSGHHTYSEYGPVGVVAAISPWNFPLMMASWKVAPAIAWGNTCVVKPSEDTPASVTMLGRLAVEAGIPARRHQRAQRPRHPCGLVAHRRRPRRPGDLHRLVSDRQGGDGVGGDPPRARLASSSAARAPTSSSRTPTSTTPCTGRRRRSSATPARSASPARGSSSRPRSTTSSWSASSPRPRP